MNKIPQIQHISEFLKAINIPSATRLHDFLVIDYGNTNLEDAEWLPAFRFGCFEINLAISPGCPVQVDNFTLSPVTNRLSLVSPYRLQTSLPNPSPASAPHKSYSIMFRPEFMYENFSSDQFIKEFPFFSPFKTPVIYLNNETSFLLVDLILKMQYEQDHYGLFSKDIIKSYLQVFLLKAKQQYHDTITQPIDRASQTFHAFTALVQQHYKELNTVKQYADLLHISPKHLSETVKQVSGLSALQYIHQTQLTHASNQLLHSGKTVSEIAYELNFENPDYFSVFFKRLTGKTPIQFRHN
jgi:AraC-type DNA-binding domain-containing proteins